MLRLARQVSGGVYYLHCCTPPVPYVYYPPPVVSYSSPASGPVLGATVVVVHGR